MTPSASSAGPRGSSGTPGLLGPWLALGVGLAAITAAGDSEPIGALAAAETTPIVRSTSVGSSPRLAAVLAPAATSPGGSPSVQQLLTLDDLLEPADPGPLPAPAKLDRLFSVSGQPVKELPPDYHHHLLEPRTVPNIPDVRSRAGDPAEEQWWALRQCESSNNYAAVNPSGKYRGAYQFDIPTWESVGGNGDPAAASPTEQDQRALLLYQRRGAAPWPVCGRHLR